MNRKFIILTGFAALLFGFVIFFRIGNIGTSILWNLSDEGKWILPLVGISALIDSINPCAFGILLLTIGFLFSTGRGRSEILKMGGIYIFGLFAAYVMIGLGILQALHLFNTPHFMAKAGAVLLVALGSVNIINEFAPSFPIKLRLPKFAHHRMAKLMEGATPVTVLFLGFLVGLCEFPCTGGPYLMVLGLLHDRQTYMSGVFYLLFYNLIFILPLAVILFIANNRELVKKIQTWKNSETKNMRLWGGITMILLGMLILII